MFCGIVAGEIPAEIVLRDDDVVAFRDLNPQAPLHALVVPRLHVADAAALAEQAPAAVASLVSAAHRVATEAGHDSYRLVLNTGADAGQTVFHAHVHVLAGRSLTWPPG